MSRLWPLSIAAIVTAVGLANLASASGGVDGGVGRTFYTQAVSAFVALGAGIFMSRIPVARLKQLAWPAWLAGVGALVGVLALGIVGGGARSWLLVGGSTFQPSEAMKLLVPLALAAELSKPRTSVWRRIGAVSLLVGVPVLLVGAQPDMGAVMLLVLAAGTVIWLAGLPWKVVIPAALAGFAAAPFAWTNLKPYQQRRILTFLDPTLDPQGAGYQTLQSQYAVAAGGWRGEGWFASTQGRLGFLPAHETDFILAVMMEEWGVWGGTLSLLLLFGLVATGLLIASRTKDRFTALLSAGIAAGILWQVIVNAGGVLGIVPLTGVTLPFLSRGGSSLLVAWASIGVLMSCAASTRRVRPLLSRPVDIAIRRESTPERDAA